MCFFLFFFFFPFSPYGCVEAEGILRLLILSLPVLSLGFEAIIRTAGGARNASVPAPGLGLSSCLGAVGHWHGSFRAFGVHSFPESCPHPNELLCLFLQDIALLEYQHHSRDYASHLPPGSIMQPQRRRPSLLSEFQPGNERYQGLLWGLWGTVTVSAGFTQTWAT